MQSFCREQGINSMNIMKDSGRLKETEERLAFSEAIGRRIMQGLFELALCIPFYSEALHMIDRIITEINND
jgi:hypothetical protein